MALELNGLNHISRACKDIDKTKEFYTRVLGFQLCKRPASIDCDGYWLFGLGIGLHLLAGEPLLKQRPIDHKSDHISFTANDLDAVERKLRAWGIETVRATVHEGGVVVSQIFFHDPDHNMIEICNCNCLPVVPLSELHGAQALEHAAGQHPLPDNLWRDGTASDDISECTGDFTLMRVSAMSSSSLFPSSPPSDS